MVYITFTLIFPFCIISGNSADFWMILQQCSFFLFGGWIVLLRCDIVTCGWTPFLRSHG